MYKIHPWLVYRRGNMQLWVTIFMWHAMTAPAMTDWLSWMMQKHEICKVVINFNHYTYHHTTYLILENEFNYQHSLILLIHLINIQFYFNFCSLLKTWHIESKFFGEISMPFCETNYLNNFAKNVFHISSSVLCKNDISLYNFEKITYEVPEARHQVRANQFYTSILF